MRRALAAAAWLLAAGAARAEPVVTSPGPDRVGVTIYRAPERGSAPIDRARPAAFALITETRTVALPPGAVTVRFEGVASGIVPQSAILFGADPRERNRDAALLSRAGLIDAFTGQQVTLRRTDPATGAVTEERATIRSAADRLIVQTARGAEAVHCTGLAQTLIYPGAPAELSGKPVLSMTTRDQPGGTVQVTLAYLATGFDWDATYVATLSERGDTLNLFAWLTMASGDATGFVDATAAAVAGRVNRAKDAEADDDRWVSGDDRASRCWPAGTTSDVPHRARPVSAWALAPGMDELRISVTGSSLLAELPGTVPSLARLEALGDLKLYRIPVPVTVAARSQKQVAFLADRQVRGTLVTRARLEWGSVDRAEWLFRFRNTKGGDLGEALPAGAVTVYQAGARGRALIGETYLGNKTVDEEVELPFATAQGVTITPVPEADGKARKTIVVRNANPFAVRFEAEFDPGRLRVETGRPGEIVAKPGKQVWQATLQPNSETRLTYVALAGE